MHAGPQNPVSYRLTRGWGSRCKPLRDKYRFLLFDDKEVEVQAYLMATFQRDPDKKYVNIYSVLIGALIRRAGRAEPPKIALLRSRETCPAVA
jgi:hypothetical protein